MEKGFFQEEGIKLEPVIAQTGAAITAAVVSGEAQVGAAGAVPEIQAGAKGLPIKIVAPVNSAPEEGTTAVMVKADGPIKTAKDLNGKTVAVNALKAFSELVTRAAVDKLGGDSSTIKFTAVDFPEMVPALAAGRADAGQVVEPFLTLAKTQGFKVLFWPATETEPGMVISTLFSSDKYISEHPDVIERFQRAVKKSNQYAQDHNDEVRRVITTYTQIKPDVAKQITLPNWDTDLNVDSLKNQADLMVKYDFIDKAPNVDDLVHTP
jgi:NitT/TauT family transport system substrate-binding protein